MALNPRAPSHNSYNGNKLLTYNLEVYLNCHTGA